MLLGELMDMPMRRQTLHRAEESTAQNYSSITESEQHRRGGRLRVRGWEVSRACFPTWCIFDQFDPDLAISSQKSHVD